jgi:hypothetical protein
LNIQPVFNFVNPGDSGNEGVHQISCLAAFLGCIQSEGSYNKRYQLTFLSPGRLTIATPAGAESVQWQGEPSF